MLSGIEIVTHILISDSNTNITHTRTIPIEYLIDEIL